MSSAVDIAYAAFVTGNAGDNILGVTGTDLVCKIGIGKHAASNDCEVAATAFQSPLCLVDIRKAAMRKNRNI